MNRKKYAALMCLLLAAAMCAGGSRTVTAAETTAEETVQADMEQEETVIADTEEIDELADEDLTAEDEEADISAFEEALEEEIPEITVADYDPSDYVTLGEYIGLDVDQLITEVTDDDVESEIQAMLEEEAVETEVTDGAAEEDYITFSYTLECEGEVIDDSEGEEMEIMLGLTELGEEVDQALTGVKAGDEVTTDVVLDEYYDEEYAGKTATYNIKVTRVYRYVVPELTDEYTAANTDYATVDEWKESLKEALQLDSEMYSRYDAGEAALGAAVENAVINGYPEDLYEKVYNDIVAQYAYFFGDEFTSFIAEEDLADAAMTEVNSEMVLKAIIQKENLEMTDEQYQQYLEDNLNSFGISYETPEELKEAGGEELREAAQREILCAWLLEHDNVTQLTQEEYEEKYAEEVSDDDEIVLDMDDLEGGDEIVLDLDEEEAGVEETPAVEEGGAN